jgi:type VI secretion system protein ImpA
MDLDILLAPIQSDAPSGIDLRNSDSSLSLYYQIKDARNLARRQERLLMQGEVIEDDPLIAWQKVMSLSQEILSTQTKDLEICAWFIEALLRAKQFQGLREGFSLVSELCERYWETLYPRPDEEGDAIRLAALAGLNGEDTEGTLIAPISNVLLAKSEQFGSFALWEYQQAKSISKISDPQKKAKRLEDGAPDLKVVDSAISYTPVVFYKDLITNLEGCLEEYKKLIEILAVKCGKDAPPSSQIREALGTYLEVVRFLSRDRIARDSTVTPENTDPTTQGAAIQGNRIQAREDALRALGEIANFFLVSEPHSPLSYLIQKVVRWGRMSLPELLSELITDERIRNESFTLAGIPEQQKE